VGQESVIVVPRQFLHTFHTLWKGIKYRRTGHRPSCNIAIDSGKNIVSYRIGKKNYGEHGKQNGILFLQNGVVLMKAICVQKLLVPCAKYMENPIGIFKLV
jgi:hypothetical protein